MGAWTLGLRLRSAQEWYEKHEMLDAAQREGFTVTEALFDDWVKKGLLGKSQRKWPGRGSEAYWPTQQLSLFLDLLKGRQEKPPYPIGSLSMFPIWRWIYLGECQGGVNLPQVKRALNTWVAFRKRESLDRIRVRARHTLRTLGGESISEKRATRNELMDLYTFQKEMDAEILAYHIKSVMPHPHTLSIKGHGEARISAEWYAKSLLLVNKSYQQYEQLAELDDFFWEWARVALLAGHASALFYNWNYKFAYGVSRWTACASLEASPLDLLAYLSMAAWDRENHTNLPRESPDSLVPALDLLAWQTGKVTFKIDSDLVFSPLVHLDGSNHAYFCTNVHLHLSNEEKEYSFELKIPFL